MAIQETSGGRSFITGIEDIDTVGNKAKPKGFRTHWQIIGRILSCWDFTFYNEKAGRWVNTKSSIHYMQRNSKNLGLEKSDLDKLRELNDHSSVEDVKDLFGKVIAKDANQNPAPQPTKERKPVAKANLNPTPQPSKNPKSVEKPNLNPIPQPAKKPRPEAPPPSEVKIDGKKGKDTPRIHHPKLIDQFTIRGRYDRAGGVNEKTLVSLFDDKVAYPANHIQLYKDGAPFIVAESPKGVEAIDWTQEPAKNFPNDDQRFYYEMVWKEDPLVLISAADVYGKDNKLDLETFNFIYKEKEFTMTNGEQLKVECIERYHSNGFDIRCLNMCSRGTSKTCFQYIMEGAFRYRNQEPNKDTRSPEIIKKDNHGLVAAKYLYKTFIKDYQDGPIIVNCNTGKDRSAALIMWMLVFQQIDKGQLQVEEVTHDYLMGLARTFEQQTIKGGLVDHVKNTIPLYYPSDSGLQEAIKCVNSN